MASLASSSSLLSATIPSTRGPSNTTLRKMVVVRASSNRDGITGLADKLNQASKKELSRDDILKNQAEESSVGAPHRPEIDRRPETGDRSFGSLMAFGGAGPETINGRLAMVGIVWAFLAERATGLTVGQQLFASGGSGLFNFLAVVQLLWYASLVPMFRGESPDSRQLGIFRAKAERWNGRTAMIGFLSLLLTEAFTKAPVFHSGLPL